MQHVHRSFIHKWNNFNGAELIRKTIIRLHNRRPWQRSIRIHAKEKPPRVSPKLTKSKALRTNTVPCTPKVRKIEQRSMDSDLNSMLRILAEEKNGRA